MDELSFTSLSGALSYERGSGCLYWRERSAELFASEEIAVRWNARYAGSQAFTSSDKDGYKVGTLFGRTYKAHRIVWFLMNGVWPSGRIDHIDGDRSNNRAENLRLVDWSMNCRNRAMGTKNTSGMVGVRLDTQTKKWQAYVKINGKLIQLGKFDHMQDAVNARTNALPGKGFTSRHGLKVAS